MSADKMPKRTIKEVLESNGEDMPDYMDTTPPQSDNTAPEDVENQNPDVCSDCGDQPKEIICINCDEGFCEVCFEYIHRGGKRKFHKTEKLAKPEQGNEGTQNAAQSGEEQIHAEDKVEKAEGDDFFEDAEEPTAFEEKLTQISQNAEYIPMRLTFEERKLLRLLNAALDVSEYTDKVDCFSFTSKAKRIYAEIKEMCTVLTGLVVANGMDIGRELVEDKDFIKHAEWYQKVFEVGRRYKIMNPDRMRSNYGKMMYMIMDSRLPQIKEVLEFDLYKPVLTVGIYLEQLNKSELLKDPALITATMEINAEGKSRRDIQMAIRTKERAIERLVQQYGEPVRQAIYSLGDFHSYLGSNQLPVENILNKLKQNYSKDNVDDLVCLAIQSGKGGARLTHGHEMQYQYTLQSLTLWHEIMGEMFLLWKLADDDLLDENRYYNLMDTGQGLNRIKGSPKIARMMHKVISRAQRKTGSWVGSSAVHLGDTAVPNSLFFLDKYLQVPWILNPINNVLKLLPSVCNDELGTLKWVESSFNSLEQLELTILTDFFKYGFDGSGADNFYDAGSCIDGRLTSAWNWTNNISKKSYYKQFLITGFVGFNGTEGF